MNYSNIAISRAIRLVGGGNHCSLSLLITVSILLCVIAALFLQYSEKIAAKREKRDPKNFKEILGLTSELSTKEKILVGMASNFIFGFIDNGGLFVGMNALDPYFPVNKWGKNTQAGIGNTYSDILGSFLGTFIGNSIQNYYGIKDTPLWAEVVGITAGCLSGIIIPRMILGDSKIDV